MGYVEIEKSKHTAREEPLVTIGAQGVVYLNSFLMRTHFKNAKFVVFEKDDEDKKKFAIKPVEGEKENSFRLNYSSASKSTGVIAARSVIKGLKIDFAKTKQYKTNWDSNNKLLEVKL